ncbi:hypothetical protein GLAREA_07240 [Glarea lozoyensis ATCC 20868]|uniref:Uncharacterized protein n=1 Tax=Glarea lozoyensis (strain ATCC 20868 / MF5171) TaxID=1116229 RepID=S3D6W1_GLAL2|nr:uncharacterized protein GLAREA_07240 [Glarea lozoyensis ATCC 20868]EPE34227.1 hypothetical protein GLAREA_07240 [Glarea lozoyensis ATCC 20868]
MSQITLPELNNFLALLASPASSRFCSNGGDWNGWLRKGTYTILNTHPIGTFSWHPKTPTEVRINMKFSQRTPALWGVSLDVPEAASTATTFWERKLALERRSQNHFHSVASLNVRHVSHAPAPGDFLWGNSVVFQAKQGMDFWFYKDGSEKGFVLYVKGLDSLEEEDMACLSRGVRENHRRSVSI